MIIKSKTTILYIFLRGAYYALIRNRTKVSNFKIGQDFHVFLFKGGNYKGNFCR